MATRVATDAGRVLALAGPTACGKSAAALAIARELDAEIISVDSALVYRGMDIGTAKPNRAERQQVPHHLIDIRDPRQPYSAAEFASDARALITQIHSRGKTALLVGGTMLYFKALFDGLDAMPPADASVRAQLESEAAERGWPALHAELQRVDAVTADRLPPQDSQRIQRALEVYRVSGRPLSSFHAMKAAPATAPAGPAGQFAGATPLFSLEPEDRGWLHARIADRFDAMLAAGFIDEVKALRARGDLHADLPSMRCVGYRQAWADLDEQEARGSDTRAAVAPLPLAGLRDRGIFATRQLAKRQLTWLRGMPQRRVIACDAPDALDRLLAQLGKFA
ncbi:MAG: tRNA (adenosine(37)-N6)-dimethylallyltransferase MiaA [Ramlibacter sp.]|nr:tRNA (adenosine(37)-N6)-dimethylallyltransferase MiaA [Ramlibacter sp.]